MKNKLLLSSLFITFLGFAQVKIGNNSTSINANSLLELESTDKGLLLPRIVLTNVATALPFAAHTKGMLIYNTSTSVTGVSGNAEGIFQNDGSKWVQVSSASNSWLLNGNAGTTAGTNFIGTTDSQPLIFKVNNKLSGYVSPTSSRTFYGENSGASMTGSFNVGIGTDALRRNTTGNNNIGIGHNPLDNNTTGGSNTAIGNYSMSANLTGNNNVSLGHDALRNNTSGNNNTAIGTNSLQTLTTGSNNTTIGFSTNVANIAASNQLNLANIIFGTGLTGTVTAPAGNIGIGTSAPAFNLDVVGTIRATTKLQVGTVALGLSGTTEIQNNNYGKIAVLRTLESTGDNPFFAITTSANGIDLNGDGSVARGLSFSRGAIEVMRIHSNNFVGIGTTTPAQKLHVAGSVQIVDGTEGVGKALVSDAAGKGTWTVLNTNSVNTTAVSAGTTTATVTGGNLEFLQNSAGMILLDSAGVKWKVTISTTGQLTIQKSTP